MKRQHQGKTRKTPESTIKGRIAELVVAAMHDLPNVQVDKNVRLKPIASKTSRKREIDVLLSASVAGYPIRIAIECKNYKRTIDAPLIDAFIGKLQDVGIPVQQGIYVSAKGFSAGAIDRAEKVGIRLLMLTGLTEDRLAVAIHDAIQSVIYILVEITDIQPQNSVDEHPYNAQAFFLYNEKEEVEFSIPDLIWRAWADNLLPLELGQYDIDIEIPKGLYRLIDGKPASQSPTKISFQIHGLVLTIHGQASHHALINAFDNTVEKEHMDFRFTDIDKKYVLQRFGSEEELKEFFDGRAELFYVIGRIQVPRIVFKELFWPLSERVVRELQQRFAERGLQQYLTLEERRAIEGSDLNVAWEPVWSGNPILQMRFSSDNIHF